MHVLFICQRVPFPPNKGEKIRTFNQIKFLLDGGHQVIVVCPLEDSKEQAYANDLSRLLNIQVISCHLPNKFFRYSRALLQNKPLSVNHFYCDDLQKTINKLIAQDIELILCSSSSVVEYYFSCQKSAQIPLPPLIVDFMDLDSLKWHQYKQFSGFFKSLVYSREARLMEQYEFRIQQTAKQCLFTSKREAELFKKKKPGFTNIYEISNGIDLDFFRTQKLTKPQSLNFIFTGVMDYFPNVDGVCWFCETIWPDIIKRHPEAKFTIVGMNPTQAIQKLSKLPGIEVTGFVKDIREYYHQADYFIAPLRIARGIQNKVLEAFASHLPVICTSNAIQGINCSTEQHVLLADNEANFKHQIFRLINNTQLCQKLTKNSFELIESNYTWPAQLKTLELLINAAK